MKIHELLEILKDLKDDIDYEAEIEIEAEWASQGSIEIIRYNAKEKIIFFETSLNTPINRLEDWNIIFKKSYI